MHPGPGVVLNVSIPDLCRLSYFYEHVHSMLTDGWAYGRTNSQQSLVHRKGLLRMVMVR